MLLQTSVLCLCAGVRGGIKLISMFSVVEGMASVFSLSHATLLVIISSSSLLLVLSTTTHFFSTQLYQESYFNSPGEKKKKENLCSLMTCSQCITTQTLCPSSSEVMLSGFWKCSLPLVFVTSFPCGCGRARNGGGEVSANSVPEDLFL